VNEERVVIPTGPIFGPLVETTYRLTGDGRLVETGVWLAGYGSLPAGCRPKRRPPPKPMPPSPGEVSDARRS